MKSRAERDDNISESSNTDNDSTHDEGGEGSKNEVYSPSAATAAPYVEGETAIMEASEHVREAKAQRDFVARMKEEARRCAQQALSPAESTFLFYFDFAQNIECPFFGQQQPGQTYYYSPLSLYLFGIVDACQETERLHAYCYHEGDGAKGGNNVVSMINRYLDMEKGMPRSRMTVTGNAWGKHLVLVCDNCSGQNKNKMMIRYILYLVETKKFAKVSLVFLIAGHTKNPCDRMFNLLKKGYRRRNLFDVDSTISVLNENELVTVQRLKATNFRNWDAFLNTYYLKPKTVKQWHIFEVDADANQPDARTFMTFKRNALENSKSQTQQFKPCNSIPQSDRDSVLMSTMDYPKQLAAPGIRAIKKNELWKKFKKLVPPEYHDSDIYQQPTDAEAAHLKQKQTEKEQSRAVEKAARKRRYEESQAEV